MSEEHPVEWLGGFGRGLLLILSVVIVGPLKAQLPQIVYYSFDEGMGATTANLAPGVGGTATLTDPLAWTTANAFAGGSSWSQPLSANSYLTTPLTPGWSGDFTLEFAVNPDPHLIAVPSVAQPIVFSFGGQFSVALIPHGSDSWRLFMHTVSQVSTWSGSVNFQDSIPSSQWTMCSIVYRSLESLLVLYLNGIEVETVSVPQFPIMVGTPWSLGYSASTVAPYNFRGSLDEFRFWGVARTAGQVRLTASDSIKSRDVGVGELVAPGPRNRAQYYSANEALTFEFLNVGSTDLSTGEVFSLALTVDGQLIATEYLVLATTLPAGGSIQHTFQPTIDLSGSAVHSVVITVGDALDQQQGNNTYNLQLRGGGPGLVTNFPWSEDFDFFASSAPQPALVGWRNVALSGFQPFVFAAGPMSSMNYSSPKSDHSSGVAGAGSYAGVNTVVCSGVIELETPAIELANVTNPVLTFFYHRVFAGAPHSSLIVEVRSVLSNQFGHFFGPVYNLSGPSLGWELARVNLGSLFPNDVITLKFIVSAGYSGDSDIGIDDVRIHDEAIVPIGQAPIVGLASLEINNSLSPNMWPVSSGQPGPYECTVFPSYTGPATQVVFDLVGEPNQPTALLGAIPNVQVGTYPGFGQLDIGGPLDGMSGLPTGLVLYGSGFAPLNAVDLLFFTDSTGSLRLTTTLPSSMPVIPGQVLQAFQALIGTSAPPFVAISNAVSIRIWNL